MVKQAELMWAEKGSTRSGERECGHNGVVSSRPRSPLTPRAHVGSNPGPPSFVMGSPYSPYTPNSSPPPRILMNFICQSFVKVSSNALF